MKLLIPLATLVCISPMSGLSADREEVITCWADAGERLVVQLWTPHPIGAELHCLRMGSLEHMEPCAPNGGWGLLGSAETPRLLSITMDWKTAHEHLDGKVTAISGPRSVRFYALYGEGTGSNLLYAWKFTVDRHSGAGFWVDQSGESISFICDIPEG